MNMRSDIKTLCVTRWGAVLELVRCNMWGMAVVADPNAIDAGQSISASDIILVAREVNWKSRLKEWPRAADGAFLCTKEQPMQLRLANGNGRWAHDHVSETDVDSDYYIEYICHSCGHVWRSEMPD